MIRAFVLLAVAAVLVGCGKKPVCGQEQHEETKKSASFDRDFDKENNVVCYSKSGKGMFCMKKDW